MKFPYEKRPMQPAPIIPALANSVDREPEQARAEVTGKNRVENAVFRAICTLYF